MAQAPEDPRSLIDLWPSAEVFARDLGLRYPSYARVMKIRNRIPRRWWDAAVLAASKRGIEGVTHGALERVHALGAAAAASSRSGSSAEARA